MSEAIVVALISASVSLIGIFWNSQKQQQQISDAFKEQTAEMKRQSDLADAKLEAKMENYQAVTNTKIEELTREVRDHNQFARRMPVVEEQIKVANHRIEDLEKAVAK